MPTLAEQWREEGRVEGIEKGEAIGIEKGEAIGIEKGEAIGIEKGREAALKVLRRYLTQRFGVAQDHFDPMFQSLDLAAIDRLSDAAFEVKTLAEFEAILAETGQEDTNKNSSE